MFNAIFFSSSRRHTRCGRDWSSDVCSSDLILIAIAIPTFLGARQRAQDKQAQSNIRNALTTEKTFYVDNQAYTATVASLSAIENSLDFSTLDASLRGVVPTLVKVGTDVAGGVCLESASKS